MNTYAVVVGIENYDQPDWSVEGPCANAIEIARWLTKVVPPNHIHVFLDPHPAQLLADEIAGLEGVQVVRSATWTEIDEFFRLKLPADRPPNSRLLVFWSGHGCTSKTGNRIFFCRDYQEKLPNRVFNASNFLRSLRSTDFRSFTDQLFFADVCGVYNETPIIDLSEAPERQEGIHQLAYFATPEGEFARGPEGRGVFTGAVLGVLQEMRRWPEHSQLTNGLQKAFRKVGETPFRVSSASELEHFSEILVGAIRANTGNNCFHSVFKLLSDLDVVSDVYIPHYLRTVSDLGIPALANAQGLVGILRELSSLRDKELTKGMPRGLLQFLVRLSQERALEQPLGRWLDNNTAAQKNTLADIRQKLAIESLREDPCRSSGGGRQGKNCCFPTVFAQQRPHPDGRKNIRQVRRCQLVPPSKSGMQELLAEFTMNSELENVEIHFLVDPPLFDAPFHSIPLTPGGRQSENRR